MQAVSVHNLEKKFGNFSAVKPVSFTVQKGEIFGFLGANGAGKSTTIRMLCGILPPTSGEAFVNGINVVENPFLVKKTIGYMSQKFSLYADLTVQENLDFFGGIHGIPESELNQRIESILEETNLKDQRNKLTRELPGGFKQKLALSAAMLHAPEIIFLDEPTAGVDPAARRIFWEAILEMKQKGITVFVTSHYMDEVEQCDRIALMHAGEIAALDSPANLKKSVIPGHVIYFESSNFFAAKDALLQSGRFVRVDAMGRGAHAISADKKKGAAASIKELRQILTANNLDVEHSEIREPGLEDVFVYVIGGRDSL